MFVQPDGTLKSGWLSLSLEGDGITKVDDATFLRHTSDLGNYMKEKKTTLCGPNGTDFTDEIIQDLMNKYQKITDVLLLAEKGIYQAIAIVVLKESPEYGGKYLYIETLCSTAKGGGTAILERLQNYLVNENDTIENIVLYPSDTAIGFYRKKGFELKMVWRASNHREGGRRKTRRRTRRR
jgi:hypothetical protein